MWLSTKEYGELCHAIYSKFANRIPKDGFILYNNYFYMYTYDDETHRIYCQRKIEIDGNERLIGGIIREVYNVN